MALKFKEQTLEESMIDTIEDWMNENLCFGEDGWEYINSKSAREELESLLFQFGEDIVGRDAFNYVQDMEGKPE